MPSPTLPRRLTLIAAALLGPAALTGQPLPIRGFPTDLLSERWTLERRVRETPDTARIRRTIRAMTAFPHLAGTPGSKRVAEWALAQFKSWGLDARIEEFQALMPMPVEQVLETRGPRPWRARFREEVLAEDPDSKLPGILPAYAAYGADGEVTAPVIYANYGLPEDYTALERLGVSAAGKIVLTRAGPHHRAVKVNQAAAHGAVALIMYNDPKEDGFWLNRPYPRGPMRTPYGVERGGVRDDASYPGDPASPGWGARPGARRLPRAEIQGIAPIPVLSISYTDAAALFDRLEGPVVPADAWKGALGLTYQVGPSRDQFHLKVRSDWRDRPLYDVVARIPGAKFPDQWVIAGNHHDAWVFGADDPVGAAATVMEAARSLAELVKTGWRPERTLIFALWDGEEWGCLGSVEWAEEHAEELAGKAVLYLQGDNYRRGLFTSSGSPALTTFMTEVARDTRDPATGRTALDLIAARSLGTARTAADSSLVRDHPLALTPVGANTDYAAFIQRLGVGSLHVAYRNVGRGTYHSVFDSYTYFARFLDPDWRYGQAQAGAFASALLRLADAPLLPWSFSEAGRIYRGWAEDLAALAATKGATAELAPLRAQVDSLAADGAHFEQAYQAALAAGSAALRGHADQVAAINRDLYTSERLLMVEEGFPGRPWYRNPMMGASAYNGQVARTFPTIRDALELGRAAEARSQAETAARAVGRLRDRVNRLTKALADLR